MLLSTNTWILTTAVSEKLAGAGPMQTTVNVYVLLIGRFSLTWMSPELWISKFSAVPSIEYVIAAFSPRSGSVQATLVTGVPLTAVRFSEAM